MSNKRLMVGWTFAILMSPFMLAGIIFQCAKAYFESGQELAGLGAEWLDEKLGKN